MDFYRPDLDIGILVTTLVAANGLDEVLMMPLAATAGELLDLLAVVVEYPAAAVAAGEVAALTLHKVADINAGPAVVVHGAIALPTRQPADFEDQRGRPRNNFV